MGFAAREGFSRRRKNADGNGWSRGMLRWKSPFVSKICSYLNLFYQECSVEGERFAGSGLVVRVQPVRLLQIAISRSPIFCSNP